MHPTKVLFEANAELESYLLSIGYKDISSTYYAYQKGKQAFKKGKVIVDFNNINIEITRVSTVVYSEPTINQKELHSIIRQTKRPQ